MPFTEIRGDTYVTTVVDRKSVTTVTDFTDGVAVIVDASPASVIMVIDSVLKEIVVTDTRMGPPGGPGGPGGSYVHTQIVAAYNWIVNHNLGVRPIVEVRGNTGDVVSALITHLSYDTTMIQFTTPFVGTAYFTL